MRVYGKRFPNPSRGPHVYGWLIEGVPRYIGRSAQAKGKRCGAHIRGETYFAIRLRAAFDAGLHVELRYLVCANETDSVSLEEQLIAYWGREGLDFAGGNLFDAGRAVNGVLYNRLRYGGADLAAGRAAREKRLANQLALQARRAKALPAELPPLFELPSV